MLHVKGEVDSDTGRTLDGMELLQAAVEDKTHNAALEEASLKYIAIALARDEGEETDRADSDVENFVRIPGLGQAQDQPSMPTLREEEEE